MISQFCNKENPFVIAEVGQNHQGDLNLAREYIKVFGREGANAIKFQTRNNKYLFSKDAYNAIYNSENAFAETYGEHREKLELKPEWLPILKEDCINNGLKFMSTPFDEMSIDLLMSINVDIFKIASFDLGNIPLINKIAQTKKPVVMSIGGGQIDQIKASVEEIKKYHNEITILHCVSEYPCDYNRLGLNNIEILKNEFSDCVIGLSDHFNGILSGPIAYLKGALVFEKHVTLNRSWKGTDHSFALEPEGFRKFTRDIHRVRHMLPTKNEENLGKEKVFKKLGKSLIAYKDLKKNQRVGLDDLSGKIFKQQYIPVRESKELLNKIVNKDIMKGEPLKYEDFES